MFAALGGIHPPATAELCYGDALAVVASAVYGFKDADFGRLHPAGAIGKRLILRVADLMEQGERNAVVREDDSIKTAIIELSKKALGAVCIVDDNDDLCGIITDGDLRRQLQKGVDIYSMHVNEIMTRRPLTIENGKLAIEALKQMKEQKVSCLIVTEGTKAVGMLRMQNIVGAGIIG